MELDANWFGSVSRSVFFLVFRVSGASECWRFVRAFRGRFVLRAGTLDPRSTEIEIEISLSCYRSRELGFISVLSSVNGHVSALCRF